MQINVKDELCVFLSELISTMLLVFLGCLGCAKTDMIDTGSFQSSVIFGLAILLLSQAFGCVSGAHMNPAVTLAAVIYEFVKPVSGVVYIVGQILGALLGYGLLKVLLPANAVNRPFLTHGLCVTTISSEISNIQGLGIEFCVSICFIFVWCGIWDPRNAKYQDSIAVKLGLAFAGLVAASAQLTGGSMNPARSFAPALWHFDFTDHWIYWVAPLVAGIVAPLLYKLAFGGGGGGGGGGGE